MNEIFSKNSAANNNGIGCMQQKHTRGGMVNVCGIILSGNGPLKSQLYQSPFLKHYILKQIISVVDINYGGRFGFNETVRKCSNLIKQNEFETENKLIESIFGLLSNDNDDGNGNIVAIGFNETLKAIDLNIAKYVVITCGFYKFAIKSMVRNNNGGVMKAVKFAKNEIEVNDISKEMLNDERKDNNNSEVIEVVSFTRFFDKLCAAHNIELKMVGLHSPLTQQFAKGFSGCVAVLHYPINLQD